MNSPPQDTATRSVDAGDIEFGDGLEVLLSTVFQAAEPGQTIDVATSSRSTALELPGWARSTGHTAERDWKESNGNGQRFVVRVRRGEAAPVLAPDLPPQGDPMPLRLGSQFHTSDLVRAAPERIPATADPAH